MSVVTICKTIEEMNKFKSLANTKLINSSTLSKLSEKTTLVTVPSTSSVQSNQILLINNADGQPVSGILLPSNHFMLKLNQNQSQPESDQDDYTERETTSKYFSMNKSEKKMFRETFFKTLLDFMHQIVKDGRIVGSSDSIWEHVASKLDNILKPKSIYNRFILNKHSCRTRLIEAYLKDPKSQTTDVSVLNHMMKTDMHHEVVEKRPGHVDNETFYNALFAFKDKVLKDGEVAPSVDSVWNQISAHLNHALKPNSIYLRFKRNTHNCHKKLLAHCKLDPSKAKTYDVPSRKLVAPTEKPINKIKKKSLKFEDSSRFFKALHTYRHKIIQNGSIAKYNNTVWNEVSKMLDYALQPSDVHSKFIRNHDLCQTKLIEACKEDENFTPLVVPKFNKPNCVSDDTFFNVLCKYRDDILQNGKEIAKFSHPVWTQISRDLNDTLKPATVYFRVTRNSQLCLNRLIKPTGLLTSNISKDTIDKDTFFETICLYKYSIMNGDQVVDLNDPVWNEISLRLNSTLTPKVIFEMISLDKDLCRTKMIQALKTERSVFSGENPEISENITELSPIVECNILNEPTEDFNEILKEFKDSILSNGQLALKNDPIWKIISSRLKNLRSDEVYSRVLNDYENCRTQIFGVHPVNKNKLFEALLTYRHLIINNNVIANINNEIWTKISEKLNYALTPKEIYARFIKDVDSCRTKLLKSSKKDVTRSQGIEKDKFLDIIISHKDSILKNGTHAKPSDPIWREIASKLNFLVKPLTLYNNFMLNRHNCQKKLLEACEQDKIVTDFTPISTKLTSQMDHDYIKGNVDTSFEDLVSMRQKVGYVQENDFIEACLVFKNRLVKNNCIVPSTDKVWNDISKHLNYAIKAKTAYLRFKRNTHNCQEKMFGGFRLKEIFYEGDDNLHLVDDQSIENEMFFDAISIFKHSIVNNGVFAMESSPVWSDVSNLMNNLLTPDEAFWKFRQNDDFCRTKLIKKCIADWENDPHSVIKNRIQVIKSKELLWKESLEAEQQFTKMNNKTDIKLIDINEDIFYDAIYKHKSDIFHNDLIANCTSPVWATIAKELNDELEPSTIYSRFKNNMTKCNIKFAEAAQRHNFYKLKQKQNPIKKQKQLSIYDDSDDSNDQNIIIDCDDDEVMESNTKKFKSEDYRLGSKTSAVKMEPQIIEEHFVSEWK